MKYQLVIPHIVERQIDNLPNFIQERIEKILIDLENNPRPYGCKKLRGTVNEYRIRIGNYRLRYEIDDKKSIVLLVSCKDRKEVYR
ncbi:MAG: type II toxin-antitoxin system RelE/ParE family toxin [Ignavibacteria bacterium]|nr:type II toxin-antitoxin system RelE/ParE family toxin [Ignavibacteria bacterium]